MCIRDSSKTAGLSCGSDEEAELKRACLEQAEQKVLLLDSTKLGKISTFAICDIDQFDVIVTDGTVSYTHLNCIQGRQRYIVVSP